MEVVTRGLKIQDVYVFSPAPFRAVFLILALVFLGCASERIERRRLIGSWTLVATSKEPLREPIASGIIRGFWTFRSNGTFESQLDWTAQRTTEPSHFSGTYVVHNGFLICRVGHQEIKSRIWFQDAFLVTSPVATNSLMFYWQRNKAP